VASSCSVNRGLACLLLQDKDHFADLAVDAVLRLKGSQNLESIHIIKKPGGTLRVRCHANRPELLLSALPLHRWRPAFLGPCHDCSGQCTCCDLSTGLENMAAYGAGPVL
jgi:hypothetical protein